MPLSISDTIVGTIYDGDTEADDGYTHATAPTGDGTGILHTSMNITYRKWNSSNSSTGGWRTSRIRAVLNGVDTSWTADGTHNSSTVAGTDMASFADSDALINAFPAALRSAIVPKQVKSDTVYNSKTEANQAITYDKLWLFSSAELYKNHYSDAYGSNYEGTLYTRQDSNHLDISSSYYTPMRNYYESGSTNFWCLRSLRSTFSGHAVNVHTSGYTGSGDANYGDGVVPGFSLR